MRNWLLRRAKLLFLFLAISVIVSTFLTIQGGRDKDVLYAQAELRGGLEEERMLVATENQLLLHAIYGRRGYDAEERHPGLAKKVYLLFGSVNEFNDAVYRFGHQAVVPIVYYFLENESGELQLRERFGEIIEALKQGRLPGETPKLSPEARVFVALDILNQEGYSFASQFVYEREKREVKRLVGERIFQTGRSLLVGNILALEKKYKEKANIELSDIGLAASDLAVLALGGVAGVAAFKSAKAAAISAKALGVTAKAGAAMKVVSVKSLVLLKSAKYGAIASGVYVLWNHPKAVNRVVGEAGELAGINPTFTRGLFWAFVSFTILLFLQFLLGPVLWLWRVVVGK